MESRFKKENKKDEVLILKIEKNLKDALQNWSADEEVTMSQFVRILLLEEAERRMKGEK